MNFATEHHRHQSVDVAVHHIESARCQQSAQDVHLRRGLRSNGHHRTDLHGFRLFVGWSKSRRGDLSPPERRFDFKFLNFRGSLRVTTPRYLHTVRRAAARVSPCKASSHLPRRTASCPAPLSTCSRPSQLLRWAPVIGLNGNTGLFWRQIHLIASHLNSIDRKVMKFGTLNGNTDIYIHTKFRMNWVISLGDNNFWLSS